MTLCKDEHWKKWLETTEKQGGARKGTAPWAAMDPLAGIIIFSPQSAEGDLNGI